MPQDDMGVEYSTPPPSVTRLALDVNQPHRARLINFGDGLCRQIGGDNACNVHKLQY